MPVRGETVGFWLHLNLTVWAPLDVDLPPISFHILSVNSHMRADRRLCPVGRTQVFWNKVKLQPSGVCIAVSLCMNIRVPGWAWTCRARWSRR